MAFGSPGPDVDSLGWLDYGFRIPWPRRGFVRLIGLVSMHLNNYYVATESFPPPKVPPPKIPIRHPVNYLRLRFRWLQIPTACVLNKESCWRSNPKSPGLLFWVSYTLEEPSSQQMVPWPGYPGLLFWVFYTLEESSSQQNAEITFVFM